MNIVINGRFLTQPATGVQRVARELTRALDRLMDDMRGADMRIRLLAEKDADAAPLALRNIAFEPVGGARGHLWEQTVLPRHVGRDLLLCLGNTAPVASLIGSRQVAVMLHDQAYRLFTGDYSLGYRLSHRLMDRLILRRAALVLAVSETERATIAAQNHDVRAVMAVAPNGSWIDDAAVPVLPRTPGSAEGYGLYVGSFTQRKNIAAIFVAAIRLARERQRRFRFVGPANAMSRAYQAEVPAAVRHLIEFPGFVSNDALPELYRGADYLLYPSFYEASGLPPSEAMTFGCPVIVSELPVMRERCGDAALYCDPMDPCSLLRAAETILDDPWLSADLSRRGRARAGGFTWGEQARLTVQALAAACAGPARISARPAPSLAPAAMPRRAAK